MFGEAMGKHFNKLLVVIPLVWICGVANAAQPMALGFVELGRDILGLDSAAGSRFAVADVDGDGLKDFVFCGTAGDPALLVVGRLADGSIGFKQIKFLSDSSSISRVLTASVEGTTHIYTVATDGTVRDFTGWPLVEQQAFAVPGSVSAAAIGDLYGNGTADLVLLTSDHLYAYSLDTGTQLWSYATSGSNEMALAQLDADPALEIILNSGLIIDGATQATDWQYIDGFGYDLASGHLLGDSTTQFVGTSGYSSFTVFRGSPWSPLWSGGNASGGIAALETADLDNNGRDVILEGDAQWGAIHVFDTSSGEGSGLAFCL